MRFNRINTYETTLDVIKQVKRLVCTFCTFRVYFNYVRSSVFN